MYIYIYIYSFFLAKIDLLVLTIFPISQMHGFVEEKTEFIFVFLVCIIVYFAREIYKLNLNWKCLQEIKYLGIFSDVL